MFAATKPLSRVANYWLDNIRTMPNLFCAFTIFFFFLKTDIGSIRSVNYFAKSVFAVYIVHQIPAFRLFLWKNICHANKLIGLEAHLYTLSIIGIAISILIAVTLLDRLRIFIFHTIEARLHPLPEFHSRYMPLKSTPSAASENTAERRECVSSRIRRK